MSAPQLGRERGPIVCSEGGVELGAQPQRAQPQQLRRKVHHRHLRFLVPTWGWRSKRLACTVKGEAAGPPPNHRPHWRGYRPHLHDWSRDLTVRMALVVLCAKKAWVYWRQALMVEFVNNWEETNANGVAKAIARLWGWCTRRSRQKYPVAWHGFNHHHHVHCGHEFETLITALSTYTMASMPVAPPTS